MKPSPGPQPGCTAAAVPAITCPALPPARKSPGAAMAPPCRIEVSG